MPAIDDAWAQAFAEEWCAAWNAHDLERILSHYVEDFEMRSPIIVERMGEPSGTLRGKAAMRAYWGPALGMQPPIHFVLLAAYAGVNQVVIHYRSVARRLVTEVLELSPARQVLRGSACYGPPA